MERVYSVSGAIAAAVLALVAILLASGCSTGERWTTLRVLSADAIHAVEPNTGAEVILMPARGDEIKVKLAPEPSPSPAPSRGVILSRAD